MKSCFFDRDTRAIADVVEYHIGKTRRIHWMITRINVPNEHWGKGLGTKLLREILAAADNEAIVLYLEPMASGGLTQQSLEDWYFRHGFRWWQGVMRRTPEFSAWLLQASAPQAHTTPVNEW